MVLPEPTSIENAYRFLKAAFLRRMAVIEKAYGIKDLVDEARTQRGARNLNTPAELLRAIAERNTDVGRVEGVHLQRRTRPDGRVVAT